LMAQKWVTSGKAEVTHSHHWLSKNVSSNVVPMHILRSCGPITSYSDSMAMADRNQTFIKKIFFVSYRGA
jgi:hypothetical protein